MLFIDYTKTCSRSFTKEEDSKPVSITNREDVVNELHKLEWHVSE